MGIKNSLPKYTSLYEYTQKVVACIMMTDKGYSGLNIWQETSNQGTSIEDIICIIWYKEFMK